MYPNKTKILARICLTGGVKVTSKKLFSNLLILSLIVQASIGLFAFPNQAKAVGNTYYVSVADGNDTNCTGLASTAYAGGSAQPCPWQTTTKVNGVSFNPGDQILFKSGETWSSSYIIPPSSGSVGSPITFSSYGTGASPIITNQYGYALRSVSKSYITISNLDLRNTNVDAYANAVTLTGASDHITLNNVTLNAQGYGLVSDTSMSDITLNLINLGSSITNQGIYFYGAANARITVSNVTAAITTQSSYTVRILNTADITVSQIAGSLEIGGSSGLITVSDVTVTPTNNGGLYILNTVASAGSYINRVSVTSSLYAGLTFDGAANFTINDCTSSLANNNGLVVENTSYNLTFNHCVVSGATQDGFHVHDSGSHDITFNYSIAHGNGNPASISDGDGFTAHGSNYNIYFNYPISYGNTCSGFALVGASSGTLYNATAYGNGGDFSGSGGVTQVRGNYYFSLAGNNSTTGTTWVMKNNIGMNGFPREIDYTGGTAPVADYNLYFPTDPTKLASIDGTTNITWATYHATHEIHSLNLDPKFTNSGSNNFTLLSTSPAIDVGFNLGNTYKLGLNPNSVWPSSVNTLDQTLNGPGWEMGAYVYSQSSAPTVSISAPSAGTVSGTITITANPSASSPASISNVQFTLDGSNLDSAVTVAPYSITWNSASVSNGSYTLSAVATDNYGNTATAANVSITVSNPVASTPAVGGNGAPVGSLGQHTQNVSNLTSTTTPITTSTNLTSLEDQIASLTLQLNSLLAQAHTTTTTSYTPYNFTRNLSLHATGTDVKALQQYLNTHSFVISTTGAGSPGNETTLFGLLTYKALVKFQASVGLPATGFFGPMTRNVIQKGK